MPWTRPWRVPRACARPRPCCGTWSTRSQAAKKDARIKAVVLDLNDMAAGGQPTLAELTAAIRDFRSSGKKVIAHSTYYGQEQYYVASVADEIYLDPLGFVAIDGFERYRTYYKELFDKLGVEVNLFRVGAYKSAAEVYTRKDMSPEDREESLAYLNALWSNYREAVAGARGLKPDDISSYVANSVPALLAAKGDGGQGGARCEAGHRPQVHRSKSSGAWSSWWAAIRPKKEKEEDRSSRERRRRVVQFHLVRRLPARGAGRKGRARRGQEEGRRHRGRRRNPRRLAAAGIGGRRPAPRS